MSALEAIRAAGFKVMTGENERLLIAPFSKLTELQKAFLRERKSELLDSLRIEREINAREPDDDRRFCQECENKQGQRCEVDRCAIIDKWPRRCEHFITKGNMP